MDFCLLVPFFLPGMTQRFAARAHTCSWYWLATRLEQKATQGLEKYVYKILADLSELTKEPNVHICFHVAEVLECIKVAHERRQFHLRDYDKLFKQACDALVLGVADEGLEGEPDDLGKEYAKMRALLSLWITNLSVGSAADAVQSLRASFDRIDQAPIDAIVAAEK